MTSTKTNAGPTPALALHKGLRRTLAPHPRAAISARFQTAVNMEVDGLDIPLYVSGIGRGLFPHQLVVRREALHRLLALPVGALVSLDSLGIDRVLASPSHCFDLELTIPSEVASPVEIRQRTTMLETLIVNLKGTCGLGRCSDVFENSDVVRAFDTRNPTERDLRHLIGRGAGSTPAGDDMLVGAQALAYALRQHTGATDLIPTTWMNTLRACQPDFASLTTSTSRLFLDAALQGQFSSHLIILIRSLFYRHTTREQLRQRLFSVWRHGASSGTDASVGLVLASRAWLPPT